MSIEQTTIHQEVAAVYDYIVSLRRHFHQHPEVSLKEFETIQRIKEELDEIGIDYIPVGETGVLATLRGGKGAGKKILLRADIDALPLPDQTGAPYASLNPGANHACGHDGHASALLGAIRVLKSYQSDFAGTIQFAFQPAEEIGAGARQFVRGGFIDDIDHVFGIHLQSGTALGKIVATPGPSNASCDIFKIKVHGKSGHVSRPDLGRDALVSAAAIVTELQTIVSREVNPTDEVVVGIGVLHAGTNYNIIANEADIEGTVRTFSPQVRAQVLAAVERIAKNTAESHRTTIEFSNYDAAAPLINDLAAAEHAFKVAAKIVGEGNVITNAPKRMGADDFADYLAVAPGVYCFVGTQSDEKTSYDHHHEKFDIDEKGLAIAAELHVSYALEYLQNPF
ncbi:peptidase m20 [Trichococcus palustris]|jgi:amidohydrolase|uniref:Peptidase m20 n=1 Tax=Trichococcus palustris TaxID=140314 RepID=A0A143YFB9_9LACT|nr:amidohydrolase [Trichococcus palustris]CZQ88592.1 peptidase m20 [Trichococcus palustris]SFL01209.1 amidohydrolase [Trichococcus palustris]